MVTEIFGGKSILEIFSDMELCNFLFSCIERFLGEDITDYKNKSGLWKKKYINEQLSMY